MKERLQDGKKKSLLEALLIDCSYMCLKYIYTLMKKLLKRHKGKVFNWLMLEATLPFWNQIESFHTKNPSISPSHVLHSTLWPTLMWQPKMAWLYASPSLTSSRSLSPPPHGSSSPSSAPPGKVPSRGSPQNLFGKVWSFPSEFLKKKHIALCICMFQNASK